jgi:hypothetical protein
MSTFSETTSILAYMQGIGAPSVQIVKGANKKDAAGIEIPDSASTYVRFVNGDTSLGTAMLAKKVTAIDASNVRDLDVSWVEGATELGAPIKGWMVHTRGTVEVVSTFSVAELAALA